MYYRNPETQRRLKKQAMMGKYRSGVYYDPDDERYKKFYIQRHMRWLKKKNSRRVRQMMKSIETSAKGNEHKKLIDYWWSVF